MLEKILANKRQEIVLAEKQQPAELLLEALEPGTRDFKAALQQGRTGFPKIIAEIKRRSPSRPNLAWDLDVAKLAQIYNENAAAISVLTDQKFFGGSLEDLGTVEMVSTIPILRKDFILTEYQILEARLFGASAVLLIARILAEADLKKLLSLAREFQMAALVEVRDEAELAKALKVGAEIIGINNRDLGTLKVDLACTRELVPKIPPEKVIVAESGFASVEDIRAFTGQIDAVLIGTAILESQSPVQKLEGLLGGG